jgi:hypothetical protein
MQSVPRKICLATIGVCIFHAPTSVGAFFILRKKNFKIFTVGGFCAIPFVIIKMR